MPFNLRGGRPKNMSQGTYWVQRNRADSKRAEATASREQRFDQRYGRITSQFLSVYQVFADDNGNIDVEDGTKLDESMDRYNDLKTWIDKNIDEASGGDLSKLATAAKTILMELAAQRGLSADWDSTRKILALEGRAFDLS